MAQKLFIIEIFLQSRMIKTMVLVVVDQFKQMEDLNWGSKFNDDQILGQYNLESLNAFPF